MICIECGEVYDPLYVKPSDFDPTLFCPKVSCGGKVIECDDLIMPTVYKMNRKGYTTFHSCSGHPGGKISDTYITFNCLVSDMDKIINVILESYMYSVTSDSDADNHTKNGSLYFSAEGYLPETEYIYDHYTRPANFRNWDEVKIDFEKLKNKCMERDLYPILLVRPYNIDGELFPSYYGCTIKTYPIAGYARHALYDVNAALYEMATRLPDELSLD